MTGEMKNVCTVDEITTEVEEIEEIKSLRTQLKSYRWSFLVATLIIILLFACIFQQKILANQTEKEAYLLSVVVTEYEDVLLFKYSITPNQIGLGNYREAWINNPCYETILPYYTKLSEILELLEEGIFPNEPTNNVIKGNLLAV